MTNEEQLTKAHELFKQASEFHSRAKYLAWALMSHSETTPEQLADAHRVAVSAREMLETLVTALLHKWPATTYGAYTKRKPWHAAEFAEYNRPSKLKQITPV